MDFSITVDEDDADGVDEDGGANGVDGADFDVAVDDEEDDDDDDDDDDGGDGDGDGGSNFCCPSCFKLSADAASISGDGAFDKSSRLISYPGLPITLPCEGVLDIDNPSLLDVLTLRALLISSSLPLLEDEICSLGLTDILKPEFLPSLGKEILKSCRLLLAVEGVKFPVESRAEEGALERLEKLGKLRELREPLDIDGVLLLLS